MSVDERSRKEAGHLVLKGSINHGLPWLRLLLAVVPMLGSIWLGRLSDGFAGGTGASAAVAGAMALMLVAIGLAVSALWTRTTFVVLDSGGIGLKGREPILLDDATSCLCRLQLPLSPFPEGSVIRVNGLERCLHIACADHFFHAGEGLEEAERRVDCYLPTRGFQTLLRALHLDPGARPIGTPGASAGPFLLRGAPMRGPAILGAAGFLLLSVGAILGLPLSTPVMLRLFLAVACMFSSLAYLVWGARSHRRLSLADGNLSLDTTTGAPVADAPLGDVEFTCVHRTAGDNYEDCPAFRMRFPDGPLLVVGEDVEMPSEHEWKFETAKHQWMTHLVPPAEWAALVRALQVARRSEGSSRSGQ